MRNTISLLTLLRVQFVFCVLFYVMVWYCFIVPNEVICVNCLEVCSFLWLSTTPTFPMLLVISDVLL